MRRGVTEPEPDYSQSEGTGGAEYALAGGTRMLITWEALYVDHSVPPLAHDSLRPCMNKSPSKLKSLETPFSP